MGQDREYWGLEKEVGEVGGIRRRGRTIEKAGLRKHMQSVPCSLLISPMIMSLFTPGQFPRGSTTTRSKPRDNPGAMLIFIATCNNAHVNRSWL